MTIQSFLLFITIVINFWLTGVILKGVKNEKYKIFFSFLLISIAAWAGAMWFFRFFEQEAYVLFWAKVVYAAAASSAFFFLMFTVYFPQDKPILGRWLNFGFALFYSAIVVLSAFSGFVISGAGSQNGVNSIMYNGLGNGLYGIYILVLYGLGIYILFKKYNRSSGLIKLQLRYILLGAVLSIIISFFNNFILTFYGDFRYNWIGPTSTLIMVICIAYAITRYRFMDIRFILRKFSVYAASLASILIPALLVKAALNNVYKADVEWLDYVVLVIAVIFFPALRDYYFRLANRYFFTSLYDAKEVIADLSDKLSSTLEIDKIFKFAADSISGALHVKSVRVYIFNKDSKRYEPRYSRGEGVGAGKKPFAEDKGFYTSYLREGPPLILSEVKKDNYVKFRRTIDFFQARGAAVIVPLHLKDRTVGLIALGGKESGDSYNDEDVGLLRIVGDQAAIAIDNALNYEQIKNFSKKLQKEVERATEDLIRANAKLRQLDQAKSEFVSIASHQLRTPLTVIKGYISMMLEGSFGRLPAKQRESLEKVFHSNERLIQLVENLLNISRIESGRLKFNKHHVDLLRMVENIAEELNVAARKKKLALEVVKPKDKPPLVPLDQEKIRQVILNLIDNAIKYSDRGKIRISLARKGEYVKCCIKDNGMGISQEDIADLFEKFSRGSGTALVHTEGTGLGLYVARQMVEGHHGKIWAESEGEGKGSLFCFTLPIYENKNNGKSEK